MTLNRASRTVLMAERVTNDRRGCLATYTLNIRVIKLRAARQALARHARCDPTWSDDGDIATPDERLCSPRVQCLNSTAVSKMLSAANAHRRSGSCRVPKTSVGLLKSLEHWAQKCGGKVKLCVPLRLVVIFGLFAIAKVCGRFSRWSVRR